MCKYILIVGFKIKIKISKLVSIEYILDNMTWDLNLHICTLRNKNVFRKNDEKMFDN